MIKWLFPAFLLSLSLLVPADENGLCDKLEVVKKNSQQQLERFTFTQLGFDKSARDLAIIVYKVNLPAQIQRATFGRGHDEPACYFKPLAFAQGGEGKQYWVGMFLATPGMVTLPQAVFDDVCITLMGGAAAATHWLHLKM